MTLHSHFTVIGHEKTAVVFVGNVVVVVIVGGGG